MEEKKTSLAYKVIRWLVWLFSPKMTVEGMENMPAGPVILVGNHAQMYGPIGCEIHLPFPRYIWCAWQMMYWKEVHGYAYQDFWSQKPKGVRWFYRILSYLVTPLAVCIFNNAHTIPVWHDTRLVSTFRTSMQRLQEGNHLIIFPAMTPAIEFSPTNQTDRMSGVLVTYMPLKRVEGTYYTLQRLCSVYWKSVQV